MSHITHKHSTYAYDLSTVPSRERIHIPPKRTRKIIDSNIPCTWGYASSQEGSFFTRKESEFQLGYLVFFKKCMLSISFGYLVLPFCNTRDLGQPHG